MLHLFQSIHGPLLSEGLILTIYCELLVVYFFPFSSWHGKQEWQVVDHTKKINQFISSATVVQQGMAKKTQYSLSLQSSDIELDSHGCKVQLNLKQLWGSVQLNMDDHATEASTLLEIHFIM